MQKVMFKEKKSRAGLIKSACFILTALVLLLAFPLGAAAANDNRDTMSPRKNENKYEGLKLVPGGMAFGVKFYTEGVLVVGISEVMSGEEEVNPAYDAGIRVRDVIVSVNGTEVNSVKEISELIEKSDGTEMKVVLLRSGAKHEFTLFPAMSDSDGKYKAGMWLRDSTAGIGTVTFIDPTCGAFGGLGHGICDIDTGVLMPLKRGSSMAVEIAGIVKGKSGKPGELKGYFKPQRLGNVISNTNHGVFGVLTKVPSELSEPVSIGSRDELREGKAEIYCTLGDDGVQKYGIEISKIDRGGKDNKNFVITVTDSNLKERTGGIVQGMSGSPILQNGKLVGAVTHVMVNDPAVGYGIFIENMLDNMPDMLGQNAE